MPDAQTAAHGSTVRWRTITLASGKTVRVAVVKKPARTTDRKD